MMKNKKLLKEIKKQATYELARRDFYEFCRYMNPTFYTDGKPHLKEISNAFQNIYEGKIKKLVVSMPPRFGKSITTTYFCAWMLGHFFNKTIMRNTYSESLANDFSYELREILRSHKYLNIFNDIRLKKDKQKIDGWSLEGATRLSYFCSGTGGGITGRGCNLLAILDDPIKNIEDGLSPTILEKTWKWYTSTHVSRMEKNCSEIIIATRWNTEDIIGKVIKKDKENNNNLWHEVVVPALNEEGESTCPEIKTTEDFMYIKQTNDDFIWDAEYMQRPVNVKGVLFQKEELNTFKIEEIKDKKPTATIGYADTADQGEDNLASIIGYLINDFVYITDVIFTQDPIEITESMVLSQILHYNPSNFTIESNAAGRSFSRNIQNLLRKNKCKTIINNKFNSQNKETRILMKSGQIKKYFVFRNDYKIGSDYDKFMRELCSYVKLGKNKHDDAVDAATGLAEVIFEKNIAMTGKRIASRTNANARI